MRLVSGLVSHFLRLLMALIMLWALAFFLTRGVTHYALKATQAEAVRKHGATGIEGAKEALILAEECLAACLGSAPTTPGDDPRIEVVRGGRLFLAFLKRHSRMRQRQDVPFEITGYLGGMGTNLGRLCLHTMPSLNEARNRSLRDRERHIPSLADYNKARLKLDKLLPVSDAERLELTRRLQPVLDEARLTAVNLVAAQVESEERGLLSGRATSPAADAAEIEEMKYRRMALREEQEWGERQQARRDALHQEAMDSWRRGTIEGETDDASGTGGGASDSGASPPMDTWETRYRSRTSGAQTALDRYVADSEQQDRSRLAATCRALFSAVSDVLRDESVLTTSQPEAGRMLKSGYETALEGARACLGGDGNRADERLAEAARLLRRGFELATAG